MSLIGTIQKSSIIEVSDEQDKCDPETIVFYIYDHRTIIDKIS